MSKILFLSDSYLKESPATVVSVKDDKYVTLDQTIFYAKGGGQPYDTGKMIRVTESSMLSTLASSQTKSGTNSTMRVCKSATKFNAA